MKLKQIKMYSFGRSSISEGVISSENLEENIVTLTDSFLMMALESYKNEEIQNGQLIVEIIKVMLPGTEDEAKEEWETGLTFKNKKYFAWFATTGGMKAEENYSKCETIFIQEDFKKFSEEFEGLISLGKFKEIEDSKAKICINKDVLSRLSLGTSSCFPAGDMPEIIVLPQPKFHIAKDYKTVEKFTEQVKDKKGNMVDQINYKLVDYHFDQEIDIFDGGAIATPKVFKQIRKELKLDYPVEFAIIRGYGIGIKGMITKFNITHFLDVFYKGDTEYCKKIDGTYYLLDMWKEWQPVTDSTILLNESMVKLAKYYDTEKGENISSYQERIANVDPKYKDIIGKLYVTKVNKKDEEIEDYRRLNYQLLTALALSKKDYFELLTEDVRAYRKILKPFDKNSEKDEWLVNIDTIRLFFKNIIIHDDEESEEFQEEIKNITSNVVNKSEELLSVSEDFIHLKYVKNNLARLIEKKCRELACGKITAKAKYQYIAVDPISFMNFAMKREQGENGLKAGEFYSADCNDGDIRTIARNPLCAYSEIHNVKFIRNPFLDNYLSPCRELIYFNQKSDIYQLMSSADSDGDACTVIDSDIIRNAVVTPSDGKYFINRDDGHKELMEYTKENRFLATYRASGNLIGSIALKSASINSNSQETLDYYNTVNNKFVLYSQIDDIEYKEAYVKEKIESKEWLSVYKASEQHREHIRQRFINNEKDIYVVLYNAMVSIDAPKTLYFPSKADMEIINKKYGRKAWFLQYKESRNNVVLGQYTYTFGLLDSMSKSIKKRLLSLIDEIAAKFDNKADIIQKKLINADYKEQEYTACFGEVENLYKNYTGERQAINKECNRKCYKESKYKEEMINNSNWSQLEDDLYYEAIASFKAEKIKKYKDVDAKYIPLAEETQKKYDIATIANAIGNMKNCTEDFIINLFFPVFYYLNDKLRPKRYIYKKDPGGDIAYLYEKYKKIPVEAIDNRDIVKSLHLEEKKRLKIIDVKTDIRARILDGGVVDLIKTELKKNGQVTFDVKAIDNKAILLIDGKEMLEVFEEYFQIKEYSLLKCSSIKFEILVKVDKKSLRLTATGITI
ncbi:hypothetical protein SAMN05660649_03889 [Desulfotomaculum arcticum]|uniref:RNA dependent RNA polymerase n=1 Tax=Desulfotruncus arcticus DSM 17038 TaxID=1121424 RepID=A0A1I2XD12_9FIRM|nr:hypothetical protein [Desulfotruncus arcticus]SFH10576.1 hypothetical protein SAMN05660649_03889 [Desulfotomaculum arcticum] [Desulfotruncus arcticus DSM 17038]